MMISMQNTYSPIDGSLYVERPYADDEQISAALDKAKTAQVLWKKLHLSERKIICTILIGKELIKSRIKN